VEAHARLPLKPVPIERVPQDRVDIPVHADTVSLLSAVGESGVKTSNSIVSVQSLMPVEEFAARSAAAGFDAVELAVTDHGPLSWGTPEIEYRRVLDCVQHAGLGISALAADGMPAAHLVASDFSARRAASQQIVTTMDRARWLGTDAVVLAIHSESGRPCAASIAGYETVYGLAIDALMVLRFEAEQRAVHIVLGGGWNDLLGSPFVVRRLIDEISSPWVGVSLNISGRLPTGRPEDWLSLLGHRVIRVYVGDVNAEPRAGAADDPPAGPGADWSAPAVALRQIRYAAPITYRGHADAQKARVLLGSLLTAIDRTLPPTK
jgi:L-ribulose-5-phosphate 3-epimerase